jgi:hypothetical protein
LHTIEGVALSRDQIEAILNRIASGIATHTHVKKQNHIRRWDILKKPRRCTCLFWNCGVHDAIEGFKRKAKGESNENCARILVRLRLGTANPKAIPREGRTPISDAIADFMTMTSRKEVKASTLNKVSAPHGQLEASCECEGYPTIQSLDGDSNASLRKTLADPNARYKNPRSMFCPFLVVLGI